MLKSGFYQIADAEIKRYEKIQMILDLLCKTEDSVKMNVLLNGSLSPFKLGKRIVIDGRTITIGRLSYDSSEIKKLVVNTEGSMRLYAQDGKKLCGSVHLNVSLKNIELFCVWIRQYRIPVEVVSGKWERVFQYVILAFAILVFLFLRFHII